MVLQVNDERATIWTKPDDWEYNVKAPKSGLVPGHTRKSFWPLL